MNTLLNLLIWPIDWLLMWPDTKGKYITGIFGPVSEEMSAKECEVEGTIPPALEGQFARNGPNPKYPPRGGYHWFDGDGMVHAVRIKNGKALYSNRFVQTKKLKLEDKAGKALFMKMGDLNSFLALPRALMFSLKTALGLQPNLASECEQTTGSTSLEYHAGKLLALSEGGLPYGLRMLCDGVLETVGSVNYDGKMQTPFTAHPKLDPVTGKLHGFGWQVDKKPYVTVYVLDKDGKLERQFPLDIPRPIMMHDTAITETYMIILDLPFLFDPSLLVKGRMPIDFRSDLPARYGLLRLDAADASDIRWFDMPQTFGTFHTLNAWEEKGPDGVVTKVHVVSCDYESLSLDFDNFDPVNLPKANVTVLDLGSGAVSHTPLLVLPKNMGVDFPQFNRTYMGRFARFGYATLFNFKGDASSVVKFDLQGSTADQVLVATVPFGEGRFGGECLFVPNTPKPGQKLDEDDGYLITFVAQSDDQNSEVCIWNAKTMDASPVATIKLPARVPMGFHGIFIKEADLAKKTPV